MTARLLIALAALVFTGAPALAANQIVVRSSGPSAKAYPIGKQLPPGAKVRLRAGDSLTVLGPTRAMVLQGPGSFKVAITQDSDRFGRTRFSSRRGPPLPRGPWAVDVEQSGQVCSTAKQKLSLWRSRAVSDSSVTITGAGGKPLTLQWPAGAQILAWPTDLPLKDGLTYRIQLAGRSAPAEWKIAVISPWSLDQAAAAEALLQHGCEQQLDQLVEWALWEN